MKLVEAPVRLRFWWNIGQSSEHSDAVSGKAHNCSGTNNIENIFIHLDLSIVALTINILEFLYILNLRVIFVAY